MVGAYFDLESGAGFDDWNWCIKNQKSSVTSPNSKFQNFLSSEEEENANFEPKFKQNSNIKSNKKKRRVSRWSAHWVLIPIGHPTRGGSVPSRVSERWAPVPPVGFRCGVGIRSHSRRTDRLGEPLYSKSRRLKLIKSKSKFPFTKPRECNIQSNPPPPNSKSKKQEEIWILSFWQDV